MSKSTKIIISLVVITLLSWVWWRYSANQQNSETNLDTKVADTKSAENKSSVPRTVSNEVKTHESAQEETAQWKTYTNKKYGYQIKYPSDWKDKVYLSDESLVSFGPIENFMTFVGIKEWNRNSWGLEREKEFMLSGATILEKRTGIIDGIKYEESVYSPKGMSSRESVVFFEKGERGFTLYGSLYKGSDIYSQMFSTFQFLKDNN